MNPHATLLMLVGEDLRRTDLAAYDAMETAIRQGCQLLMQIEFGPAAQASIGWRDDYNVTRWVHATPLQ